MSNFKQLSDAPRDRSRGGGPETPWWFMTCEMKMNILYKLALRAFNTLMQIKHNSLVLHCLSARLQALTRSIIWWAGVGFSLNMHEAYLFSLKINDIIPNTYILINKHWICLFCVRSISWWHVDICLQESMYKIMSSFDWMGNLI